MSLKILADENIPLVVVEMLARRGHDVQSVSTTSPGIVDASVLDLADQTQRLLITFDKDFGEIVFRLHRTPSIGIVFFRLGLLPPAAMADQITRALESRADWPEFFSVVDQKHIRMIPLKKQGPYVPPGQ